MSKTSRREVMSQLMASFCGFRSEYASFKKFDFLTPFTNLIVDGINHNKQDFDFSSFFAMFELSRHEAKELQKFFHS